MLSCVSFIERWPLPVRALILALVITILGIVDFYTGYELSFSIFYTIPVLIAVWSMGRSWAIAVSVISAGVWFAADLGVGHEYSSLVIPVWNAAMRLGYFLMFAYGFSALKRNLLRNESLALTDGLTGIPNRRAFLALLEAELGRRKKASAPLSLASFDLDRFKKVNDTLGHAEGDLVLKVTAGVWSRYLRSGDVIARIGGDEFCVLFRETRIDQAKRIILRAKAAFDRTVRRKGWPISCSIGLVSTDSPISAKALLRKADELLYQVKQSGRNGLRSGLYPGAKSRQKA